VLQQGIGIVIYFTSNYIQLECALPCLARKCENPPKKFRGIVEFPWYCRCVANLVVVSKSFCPHLMIATTVT
jgi:hypothetical protein